MRTRSSPPIVTQPAPSAPSAREQGAEAHGWLHPEEGWTSLVLVGLVIGATLWAVEDARWVRDMPPLELLALVAIGLGFLLAKIRLPAVFLHPVSVVVGTIALIWATASISDGENAAQRLTDLAVRMYRWWEVASSGGISNDPVPFVFQVVALDWVIAYLSAWFVFRSQHAWLAVVPSGIALLINLTYLPGRFTSYFLLYLIASMLLVSRLHLVRQQRRWRQLGVTAPATVGVSYLSHALVVAVLVVSLAWQVPIASASASVSDVWERVSGPWREFEREFDRLFASVGSGRAVPVHGFGKALPFRGAISLGHFGLPGAANAEQGAVMQVQAEQPGYWRAAAYDTYTGQGWTSSARETALMPREVRRGTEGDLARREATITVEVLSPIDVLFSLGIPLSTDARAVAEVPAPAAYTVYLTEPGRNRGLPGDLRRSADDLRDQLRSADRLYDQGEIQRMLPPDTVVQSVTRQRAEIQAVGVTRLQPLPPTTAAVRSRERLTKGARYQMTSSLSEARDEDLRQAGTDYPGWVQDHYLQLPRSVPDRVRRLAREWTDPYATPYDKAAAIERRLRMDYTYSLDILAPPQGVDGVDYFLFTLKRGYADYYASAMVVLLRSLGIPARVAVGYVPGEYDHEKEAFVVRETHAHSWPEVYFPRYGWIEFNPTPAWPVLRRTSQDPGGPGIEEEDLGMPPDADPDLLLPDDEEPSLPTAVSAGGIDWAEVLRPYAYLLAVLSLLVLVGRTAWLWGLSGLDVAAQAYEKVCRLSALAGVRMRPQDTPWEYAQRVGAAIPPVRASVLEIAQAYMRHMFGKGTAEGEEARRIDAAWRTVRSALLLKALRWRGRRR